MSGTKMRAGFGALLGAACAAVAQTEGDGAIDKVLAPPPDRWTLRFEPSVWYAAPGGELRLPGSASKVDLIDLELDRPRVSGYAELHARDGDYRVTAAGFSVSLDDVTVRAPMAMQLGSLAISAGDVVVSSVDVTSAEVVGAMQIGSPRGMDGKQDRDFAMAFELLGGVRMYHVAFDIAAPAGRQAADEFFMTPLVGVKSTINVKERFDIDLQVCGGVFPSGGDRSVFCLEITNGYTYRPVENVGVQVGYRLSFYDLGAGAGASKFEYSGAVAGIFGGVVIRF